MAGAPFINVYNISARRYAEFFDSIPAALFRTTIEGKIVYCNRAFARTFGFDSALDLVDYPVIQLNGILREITAEIDSKKASPRLDEVIDGIWAQ
jgi:PAS domain-containing protein